MKKRNRVILGVGIALCVFAACFAVYVSNGYKAGETAIEALTSDSAAMNIRKLNNGDIVFEPDSPDCGFIFYAGGKVQHTAYSPLMRKCAERGILCVLPSLTFDLAILDGNAADGYREMYPDIDRWYIGGHSLGGVMAADYASKHTADFEGLILLGSYSVTDLSNSGLRVLSIYGSEDGVMKRDKYEEDKRNLPPSLQEYVLNGGNHAYFGDYGEQKGDGTALITPEEQQEQTAEIIRSFINAGTK